MPELLPVKTGPLGGTPAPQFGPGVFECSSCRGKGKFIQKGLDGEKGPRLAREIPCIVCEGQGYFRTRIPPMEARKVA